MRSAASDATFPPFLASLDNLSAHLDEQFAGLTATDKGRRFSELVLRLLPELPESAGFPEPQRSEKESHDEGVDLLTAINEDGDQLFAQSKFKIKTKDEFDSIVSKFQSFDAELNAGPAQGAFAFGSSAVTPTAYYLVLTSSKLDLILGKYRKSQLSSRSFYDSLMATNRLVVVDGTRLLTELQRLYSRSFVLPSDVRLESVPGWLSHKGVHVGLVRARDVAALYGQYGDGLFFENIRDFLGPESGKRARDNRQSVNANIIETVTHEPAKMLARNNGVTFRAESVRPEGHTVVLVSGASIVNGCQTTMCLVHAGDQVGGDCLLPVKIVETADAWEVARAANYQNQVNQIDLDLARYLRPQLVQKAAGDLGYSLADRHTTNVTMVLDSIHQRRVDYDEVKALYLGLFSRKPNNLWHDNYTELRTDVMQRLYEQSNQDEIFETLFMLVTAGRQALARCEEVFQATEYGHTFKRFHESGRAKYRSYLAVLTASGLLAVDLQDRTENTDEEAKRTAEVLRAIRSTLDNEPASFEHAYIMAYQVLADVALEAMQGTDGSGDKAVMQEMHKRISDGSFQGLYRRLRMRIDADNAVRAPEMADRHPSLSAANPGRATREPWLLGTPAPRAPAKSLGDAE
jgi:hypothetical protein